MILKCHDALKILFEYLIKINYNSRKKNSKYAKKIRLILDKNQRKSFTKKKRSNQAIY